MAKIASLSAPGALLRGAPEVRLKGTLSHELELKRSRMKENFLVLVNPAGNF